MSQSNHSAAGLRYGEPARRIVASYDNYAEAEAAVDYLADRHFPVERIAIVGRDVKLVEQVRGRLTYPTAAAQGAAAGALPGALIGWLFGLIPSPRDSVADQAVRELEARGGAGREADDQGPPAR